MKGYETERKHIRDGRRNEMRNDRQDGWQNGAKHRGIITKFLLLSKRQIWYNKHSRQQGKDYVMSSGIPVSTMIPTPEGPKKIADIQVGESVFTQLAV